MKKRKKDKMKEDEKIAVEIEKDDETLGEDEAVLDGDSENLDDRISELEEKNKELNDRLLRRVAEFENYKRRTEGEKELLFKYASEPFILKTLPIFDDLKRSLSHIDDDNLESLRDGFKMITDKFAQILDGQGVKIMETVGKEFDYEYHEALLQQPSNDIPANVIIEEIESGYTYKDKVLIHAKVIVSQGVENKEAEPVDNEELDKEKSVEE